MSWTVLQVSVIVLCGWLVGRAIARAHAPDPPLNPDKQWWGKGL